MTLFKREVPPQVIRLTLIALVIIAIVCFKIISANLIKAKIDKILGANKEYVSYSDVSMDLFGFDVHIDDVKVNFPYQKPLIVDEITVKSFDTQNAVPLYMNIRLKGVQSDLSTLRSNPNFAKTLDELNIKEIKSDLTVNYVYEKERKMLDVEELSVNVENLGKLTYQTELYNVVAMAYFPLQLNLAPQTLKFGSTALHYEDNSLVERYMQMYAKDANLSLDSYKTDLFKRNQAKIDAAKASLQKYETLLDETWLAFLKNPKTFDFKIAPSQPVSLISVGNLKSRDDLLKTLNFSVSANE